MDVQKALLLDFLGYKGSVATVRPRACFEGYDHASISELAPAVRDSWVEPRDQRVKMGKVPSVEMGDVKFLRKERRRAVGRMFGVGGTAGCEMRSSTVVNQSKD